MIPLGSFKEGEVHTISYSLSDQNCKAMIVGSTGLSRGYDLLLQVYLLLQERRSRRDK